MKAMKKKKKSGRQRLFPGIKTDVLAVRMPSIWADRLRAIAAQQKSPNGISGAIRQALQDAYGLPEIREIEK